MEEHQRLWSRWGRAQHRLACRAHPVREATGAAELESVPPEEESEQAAAEADREICNERLVAGWPRLEREAEASQTRLTTERVAANDILDPI